VRYKHDGCSILSCPTSLPSLMPIIIGFDELEEGWESLDLRIYRTNELDLDNSSERTCFPLPPLARSPNLFLAFGQKTEDISRCRLTRLLFWWTGKSWLSTELSWWKSRAGILEEANQWITRHATPYHAPVYLAQKLGYFQDEGIKVALLEPTDPSGSSPFSAPPDLIP